MTSSSADGRLSLTCSDVEELSGLFVLDALEPDERAAVIDHLATCVEAHAEIREVGGVVPALASLAAPLDAPIELKSRVLAAVAADAAAAGAGQTTPAFVPPVKQPGGFSTGGQATTPVAEPSSVPAPSRSRWQLPTWTGWAAAAAAVVVLALVGVYALGLQSQVSEANQRAALVSDAIEAYSAPGSSTAVLDDPNSSASGFAAVTEDGTAYVVMAGLQPAPDGKTYQAWYIGDGAPVSAGLVSVGADGLMLMTDAQPMPGTQVVAFTVEPEGGSEQPTTDPFVVGQLS